MWRLAGALGRRRVMGDFVPKGVRLLATQSTPSDLAAMEPSKAVYFSDKFVDNQPIPAPEVPKYKPSLALVRNRLNEESGNLFVLYLQRPSLFSKESRGYRAYPGRKQAPPASVERIAPQHAFTQAMYFFFTFLGTNPGLTPAEALASRECDEFFRKTFREGFDLPEKFRRKLCHPEQFPTLCHRLGPHWGYMVGEHNAMTEERYNAVCDERTGRRAVQRIADLLKAPVTEETSSSVEMMTIDGTPTAVARLPWLGPDETAVFDAKTLTWSVEAPPELSHDQQSVELSQVHLTKNMLVPSEQFRRAGLSPLVFDIDLETLATHPLSVSKEYYECLIGAPGPTSISTVSLSDLFDRLVERAIAAPTIDMASLAFHAYAHSTRRHTEMLEGASAEGAVQMKERERKRTIQLTKMLTLIDRDLFYATTPEDDPKFEPRVSILNRSAAEIKKELEMVEESASGESGDAEGSVVTSGEHSGARDERLLTLLEPLSQLKPVNVSKENSLQLVVKEVAAMSARSGLFELEFARPRARWSEMSMLERISFVQMRRVQNAIATSLWAVVGPAVDADVLFESDMYMALMGNWMRLAQQNDRAVDRNKNLRAVKSMRAASHLPNSAPSQEQEVLHVHGSDVPVDRALKILEGACRTMEAERKHPHIFSSYIRMLPLQRKPDELLGEIGSVLSYMRLHRVPGMIEVYLAAQEVLANARNSEAVLALFHHLVEKDERTLTITVEGAEDLTTSIGMQRQQAVADLFSRTMKAAANCADRDSIERVYEVARDVGAVGMVPTPFWIEYIKMVAGISGIYPAFGVYGEMIKYATIQLHPGFFNHLFSRCGGSGLPHFALRLMQDMDFVDVEMSRESLHTVFQILTQNTGASLFAEKSLVTAILANNLEHAFELFRMTSAGHYGHPVDTVMVQYLVAGCMDSHQADRAVDFLVALAAKQLPGVGMERVTLPSVVCERALLSYCMKNKSPYVFADFLLRMAEVSPSYVPQLRLGVLIASVNEQTQHRIKNAYGRNFAILLR